MPEADDRQGRIDPGLAIEPVRAAQPEGADDLTIFLPAQVTLLPTYVFTWLGWNGTWLPLIIPHCLANAFTVFLLRQYFMSIPRDLGEAAMIDGAGPFRILRTIIVPQSIAAVTAVTLFHFFFAWNDFFLAQRSFMRGVVITGVEK